MKKRNKILLCILTIFVFVGMLNVRAITTNDQSGTSDPDSKFVTDTGLLSVTGVQSGDQFRAYKILDTYYNASTNVITYEFTTDFKAFLGSNYGTEFADLSVNDYYDYTSGNIESGSTLSTSDVDRLASAYAGYIRANSISGTDMNVSGTTASATVQAGSYLVLPTSTVRVYAVMVGNIDFSAVGTDWQINSETIVAKVSDAGVTKSVGEDGYDSGSYSIGDDIPFIVVGTVPTYPTNATNRTYIITDTLSEGLDFNAVSSVTIQDGGETLVTDSTGNVTNSQSEQVATIQISDRTMTITFNTANLNSNTVTVRYTAKLNNQAGLGASGGNHNSVELTYSNDPYGEGTYTTSPDDDGGTVDIFMYGLEIYKYDNNDGSPVALAGAEFTIYKDRELDNAITTVSTGSDGIARYAGLAQGTYYVQETKSPTGYRLDNTVREIKIGPGEGSLDAAETEGYYRLEVANTKAGLLPVTGGIGTIAITLVGLVIVGGAIYFFFVYRKKKQQEGQA